LAKAVLIDLNPLLTAQKLALKYPHLRQAGQLYASIVRKLTPSKMQGLVRFAQQLAFQEWLRPSVSSLHLRSRVKAAVSSALPTGSPVGTSESLGSDIAEAVVLVILMMVQDSDQDLQEKMAEAQAQMQAKQALRQLIDTVDQEMAQLAGAGFRSASVPGFRSASAFRRPRPSRGFATFVDQLSRQVFDNLNQFKAGQARKIPGK